MNSQLRKFTMQLQLNIRDIYVSRCHLSHQRMLVIKLIKAFSSHFNLYKTRLTVRDLKAKWQ